MSQIKNKLKLLLMKFPRIRSSYHHAVWRIHHLKWQIETCKLMRLSLHIVDALHSSKYMVWNTQITDYWELSSQLLFQYHKLEKGLSMPGEKRFFGAEPAYKVLGFLDRWNELGFSRTDRIYLGAIETIRMYKFRVETTKADAALKADLISRISRYTENSPLIENLSTPIKYVNTPEFPDQLFYDLCFNRRSVRNYKLQAVEMNKIVESINTAQLSPSACNRQPWKVHVYSNRDYIDQLLELQNGNRGFGHNVPTLLIITADSKGFFDASERNEPYIDAGLFTMTLLLALQTKGLASCCLNWCVSHKTDRQAHQRGNIPDNEKIIMYLAVGYASEDSVVPLSHRRNHEQIIHVH